jgi:hypothetical protein
LSISTRHSLASLPTLFPFSDPIASGSATGRSSTGAGQLKSDSAAFADDRRCVVFW